MTPTTTPVRPVPDGAAPHGADAPPSDARLLAARLPTPAGDLAVLLTAEGVVRAAGFADLDHMVGRLAPALAERGVAVLDAAGLRHRGAGPALVADAVARYAAGELTALDAVPVEQPGGPFQQRAWQAMRAIAPGGTLTYTELAVAAGSPTAVRAAGSACARNLIAPFVPCHRVVRNDGTLGGYYYGLPVKRSLLAHEQPSA
ncbi:MAG TPA: methylated-DNA--[protein]-cysteine S-methyltransferase [Cellulomonas sp.]